MVDWNLGCESAREGKSDEGQWGLSTGSRMNGSDEKALVLQ